MNFVMPPDIKKDTWVWVVVQNPDKDEQFLGQHDPENNISFIPFFTNKEDATECLPILARDIWKHYEVQAILFEDLEYYAKENTFMFYLLDKTGKVLSKYS